MIHNLVTKFYFKNDRLHFNILIETANQKLHQYQEFFDYDEYRKTYDALVELKRNARPVQLPTAMNVA